MSLPHAARQLLERAAVCSWRSPQKAVAVWLEAMGELGHSRAKEPSGACLPNLIIQSLWDK